MSSEPGTGQQLHCAIEHLHKGDFECAITLAGAAEGILPNTDELHFREKVKTLSKSPEIKAAGGAIGANDYINWLKHARTMINGPRIENATIPSDESVAVVWRAITKYEAIYKELSPQMQSFHNWAKDWIQRDRVSKEARPAIWGQF